MTENKQYIIDNLLKNPKFDAKNDSIVKTLKREIIKKPVIFVGTGTCGLGAGADKTLDAVKKYLSKNKIEADVIETGCIGLCSAEPLMDVQLPKHNRISFENVNHDKVETILDNIFNKLSLSEKVLCQFKNDENTAWKNVPDINELPFFKPQQRIVLKNCGIVNPISIDEYIANGGYTSYIEMAKNKTSAKVCDIIEASGLRGRGGGGFSTGKKWKFALNTEADQKYLICNADEGDPGAFMDRAVIEGDPHRLIEGMAIAAFGIGATKSYVYIRAEYPLAIKRLNIALEQAKEYGLLGKNILYFASIGTEKSKGTKVFALSGKIAKTGLVEIPMGTTVREVIFDIAGGVPNNKKFKSVQIGGPSGGCITEENLDISIDYDSLIEVGAMMGSGGLVVMDEDTCMVDVAKFFMDFIQRESCGKCIPCREGTRRMLEILEDITQKPKHNDKHEALRRFKGVTQLERLGKVIKETSLCGLGQTAPNPVLSTIKWFRNEYEEHIFERKCSANVCTDLRVFTIDVDKCTGCTICAKKCPTDAIIGTRKAPHFVVEDKCISCGTCFDVCKFDAIIIS